jgi:predicted oxidoreductase
MGWKECNKMDEKLKFIARYLEGEKIAPLCKEFGITRPTAYKLIDRYKMMGQCALVEQKRTPHRYAHALPVQVEAMILDLKREYPDWGAPKIREKMEIVTKTGIVFKSNNRPEHDGHYYNTTFDHIVKSAERSLQNFGTDYIDVLLIHRPDPFMDPEDVARAFNQLRSEGKVNYFGVSNFTQNDFTLLQSYLDFDLVTNQIEASVLKYDNFENETIKFLQEKRINPMIWSPLAGGQIFTSQSESAIRVRNVLTEIAKKHNTENISKIAYAWLLAHPAKLIPIVGSGKINRISEAVNALNIKLTRADWFAILDALVGHEVA